MEQKPPIHLLKSCTPIRLLLPVWYVPEKLGYYAFNVQLFFLNKLKITVAVENR